MAVIFSVAIVDYMAIQRMEDAACGVSGWRNYDVLAAMAKTPA